MPSPRSAQVRPGGATSDRQLEQGQGQDSALILAIDSASDQASISLSDREKVIAEEQWSCKRRHTVELAARIEKMLKSHACSASDLSGVAVAIGPGSYTGLRIGLSVAKGICLAQEIPIFGIGTLDGLAKALLSAGGMGTPTGLGDPAPELILILQAGRGRIVSASYPIRALLADGSVDISEWPKPEALEVRKLDEILPEIRAGSFIAGEISTAEQRALREAGAQPLPVAASLRRASWLACLADKRLRAG